MDTQVEWRAEIYEERGGLTGSRRQDEDCVRTWILDFLFDLTRQSLAVISNMYVKVVQFLYFYRGAMGEIFHRQ